MAEPFAALDMEAENWTQIRTIACVTSHGEVEHYTNVDDAARWVKKGRRPVFGHAAGGYDWPLLMPGALRAGSPLQAITLADGRIQSATLGGVWLQDSRRLCPDALAKLGTWVGLEKFEGRSDRIEQLTQREIEEHASRDCQILIEVLRRHQVWVDRVAPGRWPKTGGSNATHLLETLEPEAVKHLRAHPIDPDIWAEHHDCHQSQRTELFYWGRQRKAWVYDIRSSYARSFIEAPLPLGPWEEVSEERPGFGVYFCPRVRQGRGLPVTLLSHGPRAEGKGWLTSEEIATIREAGGDVQVERGWHTPEAHWFGNKVVELVFPLKSSGWPWAKSILTAMAGKLIQELVRDTYFHTPGGYVRDRELLLPEWYHRPLTGCFVYARARLRLYRVIQALLDRGWEVYYCDTDSIHTNCPPSLFPGIIGLACGEWQIEAEACEALYLGPKFYGLRRKAKLGEVVPSGWRLSGEMVFKVVCQGFNPKKVDWTHLEMVLRGESPVLTDVGGITGAGRAMQGLPAEVRSQTRALRPLLGGKQRRPNGWLYYPKG